MNMVRAAQASPDHGFCGFKEFRMLANHAALQAVEMGVLNNWLEVAYSAEVAARFQLDVPQRSTLPTCPSLILTVR